MDCWAIRMPSAKLAPSLISVATSSVGLISPPDISPYRAGNTGVDYVHRFDSGRSGPAVMVQALTHGNEICGALALVELLEHMPPLRQGSLTLAFANVDAFARFDAADPHAARFIDEVLQRGLGARWLLVGRDFRFGARRAGDFALLEAAAAANQAVAPEITARFFELPLREAREAFERIYFEQLLGREQSNMSRVAERAGLERTHLYRKLKQLNIRFSRRTDETPT